MKLQAVAVIVFANLMAAPSFAGTILFDPPSITITPGTQSVSFATRAVPENLTTFDSVIVIFGSLEGLALSFWTDPSLYVQTTTPPPPPPVEQGIYAALTGGVGHDVGVGANNFSANPWTSVTLGTLMVDTTGLVPGDVRQIVVDPELEANLVGSAISLVGSGVNEELLRGSVTITVVPEPTTALLFFALGGVAAIRRRRKSDE